MNANISTIDAYHDGKYCHHSDIKIGILSNSLNYGTAVIESIRVYKKDGHYYTIGINRYIKRFITAIEEKGFKLDISFQDIIRVLQVLIGKNQKFDHPYIRMVWHIGDMSVNTMSTDTHFSVVITDLFLEQKQGLISCFSSFLRKNDTLNRLKLSSNYARNIIEQAKAKKHGYNYVIFLGENEEVLEGLSENLFIKIGKQVITPKEGNILSGVNRAFLIESFYQKGIEVIQRDISQDELYTCNGIIVSGSATGIRYISQIEDKEIPSGDFCNEAKQFYIDQIREDNKYVTKLL